MADYSNRYSPLYRRSSPDRGLLQEGEKGVDFAKSILRSARSCLLGAVVAVLLVPTALSAQQLEWFHSFTGTGDGAWDMANADDGVYVLSTSGSRIFKFGTDGNLQWSTPSVAQTDGFAISFDSAENAIYTGGRVYGTLPGQTSQGAADAFLRKYDTNGNVLWTRQFGTSSGEAVFDIATDTTGVYVAVSFAVPYTEPAPAISIKKFDHNGNLVWTQTLGDTEAVAFGLAVGPDSIYVTGKGSFYTSGRFAPLWSLALNGDIRWQRNVDLGTTFGHDVGTDIAVSGADGSIYVTGTGSSTTFGNTFTGYWRNGPGVAFLAKFDSDGNQIWNVPAFGTGSDVAEGLFVDAEGAISVAGSIHTGDRPEAAVARFDSAGDSLWFERFNGTSTSLDEAHALSVLDGAVYVTGRTGSTFSNAFYISGFLARIALSEAHSLVRCLGDINGDKVTDIAMVMPTGRVLIKGLDGRLVSQFSFSTIDRVTGAEIMPDINGNGAPELVVLGTGSAKAEVRDTLTGAQLSGVDFGSGLVPVDLKLVGDQTANGVPELAMLGEDPAQVRVRDGLTGQFDNDLTFSNFFDPKDLAVYPDLNGNGAPELAVLGDNKDPTKADVVEVRDLLSGNKVKSLWLGSGWRAVQQATLKDVNRNGYDEVAVLRVRNDGLAVNVRVLDTKTGQKVSAPGFDPSYPPTKLLALSDVNGNGADEVVVFGRRTDDGKQKAQIKDSKTGKLIRAVFFDPNFAGEDIAICPDINRNGADELALLGKRASDGQFKVIVKDSKTGQQIGAVKF